MDTGTGWRISPQAIFESPSAKAVTAAFSRLMPRSGPSVGPMGLEPLERGISHYFWSISTSTRYKFAAPILPDPGAARPSTRDASMEIESAERFVTSTLAAINHASAYGRALSEMRPYKQEDSHNPNNRE